MAAPTFFASRDAVAKAEVVLKDDSSRGSDLRDAIELLLCNEVEEAKPNKGRDAGKLLQKGLAALAKQPHQALGVDIGANTQEIRKAYKKLALKYHPDKNPKTTPLFQAIQTASERLTDPVQRRSEEAAAASASKPSGFPPPRPTAAHSNPRQPHAPGNTSSSSSSKPPGPGESDTSSAYQKFMNQQRQRYAGGADSQQQQSKPPSTKPEAPQRPSRFPQPNSGYDKKQQSGFSSDWDQRAEYQDYRKFMREENERAERQARELQEARRRQEDARRRMHHEAEELAKKKKEEESVDAQRRRAEILREAQQAEKVRVAREAEERKSAADRKQNPTGQDREAAAAAAGVAARRAKYMQKDNIPNMPDINARFEAANPNPIDPGFYNYSQKYDDDGKFKSGQTYIAGKNGVRRAEDRNDKPNVQGRPFATKTDENEGHRDKAFHNNKFEQMYKSSVDASSTKASANNKSTLLSPPVSLKCTNISYESSNTDLMKSTVQLEWACASPEANFEMRWRVIQVPEWNSSKALIKSRMVRKKNLECGTSYEFRIRSVDSSESSRSEWSEGLVVDIPKQIETKNEPTKSTSKGSSIHAESTAASSSSSGGRAAPSTQSNTNRFDFHRAQSMAQVFDDFKDEEVPDEEIESSPQQKSKINISLRVDTSVGSVKTDSNPLSPRSNNFQWSPRTKANVLKQERVEIQPKLKVPSRDRVIHFDVKSNPERDVDEIALIMSKFKTHRRELFTGVWVNKKLSNELMYRKRFVWIDPQANRLYWSKVEGKEGAAKSVHLINDINSIKLDSTSTGLVCIQKKSPRSFAGLGICVSFSGSTDATKAANEWLRVILELRKDILEYSDDSAESVHEDLDEDIQKIPTQKGSDMYESPSHSSSSAMYKLCIPGEYTGYKHPVRLSPDITSPIGGYLVHGMKVEADVVEGNWILVRVHQRNIFKGRNKGGYGIDAIPTCKWGWSLISEGSHIFLEAIKDASGGFQTPPKIIPKKVSSGDTEEEVYNIDDFDEDFESNAPPPLKAEMASSKARTFSFTQRTPSKEVSGERVYEWTQCTDEHGQIYYYNVTTMESRWEPPEWVEETDPNSGASYYVKLATDATPLHSTWSKPSSFARLKRAESRATGVDDWDQMLAGSDGAKISGEQSAKDDEDSYGEEETYEYEDDDFEIEIACNKHSAK